jgi:hypothetical protein
MLTWLLALALAVFRCKLLAARDLLVAGMATSTGFGIAKADTLSETFSTTLAK